MHEADFDHDHEELYARSSDLEGMEFITLTSVGVDIGSSTSHVMFSRLTLRREGTAFSTKFHVTERRLIWASPVLLTPYISATTINFDALKDFVDRCYDDAGIGRNAVDSGAVVITGEALAKQNARPILEYFSGHGGKFVCASAGPHHEALLAAHGSGAVDLSRASHSRVLNVDIGGGTTKFSLIVNGKVQRTAAVNIGARLVAFDKMGRVTRLENAGARLASSASVSVLMGQPISPKSRAAMAREMRDVLVEIITGKPGALAQELMITAGIETDLDRIDYLMFSGGVSEYIHDGGAPAFGDLGPLLGDELRRFVKGLPAGMVAEPAQGIRATVIGASEYTLQASGATSFSTGTSFLPLHGLKAVRAVYDPSRPFAEVLREAFEKFDIPAFGAGLLLSVSIQEDIDYPVLRNIACGIAAVVRHNPDAPVTVNIEEDVARSLGHILHGEFAPPNPLLSIDGIVLGDLDYVDIGEPLGAMGTFPVTVKSLLFPDTGSLL